MKKNILISFFIILVGFGVWWETIEDTAQKKNIPTDALHVTYICKNGKSISAEFYDDTTTAKEATTQPTPTGRATILLSDGRHFTLNQTISGSGVRYANNDESFVLWNKGPDVLVLEHEKEGIFVDCTEKVNQGTKTTNYSNDIVGYSLSLPSYTVPPALPKTTAYTLDPSYVIELSPSKKISGVKFTIPTILSEGTNLSNDSYLSVESVPSGKECTAANFFNEKVVAQRMTENTIDYSFASLNGAAAGNRYEETVYAIQGKNSCIGIRYFIHYSAIENYTPGSVKDFDKQLLVTAFDAIRTTLLLQK